MSENTSEIQAPTPSGEKPDQKKEGASEILQILAVAVAAAVLGVGGYFLIHRSAPVSSGEQAGQAAPAPAAAGSDAARSSAPTGFVVIDSDHIASSALRAVQQAFQDNPAILPHLGEVGRIVGADIQAQARAYVSQGLLVYNASGLLGYPASVDRTQEVEKKVMADVKASVQRWIETASKAAPTPEPAQEPQTTPGFEP